VFLTVVLSVYRDQVSVVSNDEQIPIHGSVSEHWNPGRDLFAGPSPGIARPISHIVGGSSHSPSQIFVLGDIPLICSGVPRFKCSLVRFYKYLLLEIGKKKNLAV
jgi:hypothetical protein